MPFRSSAEIEIVLRRQVLRPCFTEPVGVRDNQQGAMEIHPTRVSGVIDLRGNGRPGNRPSP